MIMGSLELESDLMHD